MPNWLNVKDFKIQLSIEIGLWVVLILFFGSLFWWLSSDLSRRAGDFQQQRQEVKARVEAIQSFTVLKAEFLRAKPYSSVLENILPTRDQLIELPKFFASLAGKYKVDFSSNFGAETMGQNGLPSSIGVTMTMSGPYDQLVNALRALERERFILTWDAIDLLIGGEKSGAYRASLSARVFFR